jgi:hypothetical protein
MLQNAPREELLRSAAKQVTNIEPSKPELRAIVHCHDGRIYQAFWDILLKIMRASSGEQERANGMAELMDITIRGRAIIYIDDSNKNQ